MSNTNTTATGVSNKRFPRTAPALEDYDRIGKQIDAFEGSDADAAATLFRAYDAALLRAAEAFAEDTAAINNPTDVINAITHGGRDTGHNGAMLAWVRFVV